MAKQIAIPLTFRSELMLCGDPRFHQQLYSSISSVCGHSAASIEYWNHIALLPISIMEIVKRMIYGQFQELPIDAMELQDTTLIIGYHNNSHAQVTLDYLLEKYNRGEWLMVYCRSCRKIFQIYHL